MLSKVKSVTGNGSFENEYGALQESGKKLLFSFEYEMEDGTIIKANHKTSTSPFSIGSEVEYEVKKNHPEHGKSGKVSKPGSADFKGSNASKGSGGGDAVQLMIVRQSSLNRAVEILSHNAWMLPQSGSEYRTKVDELEVIELAERLTKWVMQSEKKETPTQAAESSTIGQPPVQSATEQLMDDSQN